MGIRGRKPKPIALRKFEGNPGKRPLVKKGAIMGVRSKQEENIKCPTWLSSEAKREWKRVAPILKRLNLLNALDRTALAGYCQSYARWKEAEEVVEKHGILIETKDGYAVSPRVVVAQKYLNICRLLCVEFGMTPSSLSRMTFGSGDGDEKDDEFKKILD